MLAATVRPRHTLRIAEHTVHRVDPYGDAEEEYVVSSLKDFVLRVELCDADGVRLEDHTPTPATLTLVYESAREVEQLGDVPLMTGAHGIFDHGVAAFKLKVAALSSLRQQQRFRIRVQTRSPDGAGELLEVLTAPFRTITKLYRPVKPKSDPVGEAVAAVAVAAAAATADNAGAPPASPPPMRATVESLSVGQTALSLGLDALRDELRDLRARHEALKVEVAAKKIAHAALAAAYLRNGGDPDEPALKKTRPA